METFINNHHVTIDRVASNRISDTSHPNYLNYILKVDGVQKAIAESPAELWMQHDRLLKELAA